MGRLEPAAGLTGGAGRSGGRRMRVWIELTYGGHPPEWATMVQMYLRHCFGFELHGEPMRILPRADDRLARWDSAQASIQ